MSCPRWFAVRWGISLKPLKFHPEALGELHVAPIYYYEMDCFETGDALVAELNHALNEISEHPQQGKRIFENIHS